MFKNPLAVELEYRKVLKHVLDKGRPVPDRTGIGTRKVDHAFTQLYGIPVLRLKKMIPQNAVTEAVWMLLGDTNTRFLEENGCKYWKEWADENGNLGPTYGNQLRYFEVCNNTVDQIEELLKDISCNPYGRRHIVTLWNPHTLLEQRLPPCHVMYQFTAEDRGPRGMFLNMHVMQRSADMFLGVPYDFILFTTMLHIICLALGWSPGQIYYTCNDVHIYNNHIEQVKEYLSRTPNDFPTDIAMTDGICYNQEFAHALGLYVETNQNDTPFDYFNWIMWWLTTHNCKLFDFTFYRSLGFIKAPVAV